MNKLVFILLIFMVSACEVTTESSPTVTLPSDFGLSDATELIKSLVYRQLNSRIVSKFPSVEKNEVKYNFKPVFYQSMAGKGKKTMVRVVVTSKDGWTKKDELEAFLISVINSELNKPRK